MSRFIITKAQILHLLAMFVLVPVSGWVATVVARYFPGIHLSAGAVEAVFITGCGSALGLAIHYLHGWQVWERTIGRVIDVEDKVAPPPPGGGTVTGV